MSLFERLYSNETGGLQDKFVAFWKAVATRFANNTYVLGFDPINEPFPSNMYMDPSIVYEPGRFDRYTLQPMYKRIFQEAYVEAGDMSKAMYFEPS
jgi:endoglycosylceramidase